MRVRVTVPMAVQAVERAAVRHAAVQAAIIDQARDLAARPALISRADTYSGKVDDSDQPDQRG